LARYESDRVLELDDLPIIARAPDWRLVRAVMSCTPRDPDFSTDEDVRKFLLEELGSEHGVAEAEVLSSEDLERDDGDNDAYLSEFEIETDAPFDPFIPVR